MQSINNLDLNLDLFGLIPNERTRRFSKPVLNL